MSLLANALWYANSLPASLRFTLATRDVARVQRAKLLTVLRANVASAFGRHHRFDEIETIEEYQARVPLADYEDIHPWIERITSGEQGVLTTEPVLLMEPTSGSTSATKLIPYTASLKREFQHGIAPWVIHAFGRYPALFRGQAYWSVTPVVHENQRTAGGLSIGFEEDSDYLGGWSGRAVRSIMAVPPEVKQIADLESFRYITLLFLLRSKSLALISVWNPTFLMLLLEPLVAWRARLIDDIARGTMSPPQGLSPSIHDHLSSLNRAMPARAPELADILRDLSVTASDGERAVVHRRVWPRLQVISCWADANAAPYATQLARLFPHARMQPKGLIATEAFVSFPLPGKVGGALALNAHFFEFMPATNNVTVSPLLAHELEIGQRYSVVITTGGGLYRYQMRDQIEVTDKLRACPLIRFTGREDQVSDWFGEKLNEQHVRVVLTALFERFDIRPHFAMLAFDEGSAPPAYTLYIQAESDDDTLKTLRDAVDQTLQDNYHYAYCRRIGQLGSVRLMRVRGDAGGDYMRGRISQGRQRIGDIKPTLLSQYGGWTSIFTGVYIAA